MTGVLDAIGSTPLVALERLAHRADVHVWAKLESANPGGSAKDRPAARMIGDALASGALPAGGTVVESSSGNMGVGLAQACRYHGLRLICVVDSRAHDANLRAMQALGADIRVVTQPDPDTGDLLTARLTLVASLLSEIPGAYWPDQYSNPSNPAAHTSGTMREIDDALHGDLDYVFVATSTTGTLRGCADLLRERGRATHIVAVDAVGSALFGGVRGPRELPGFGAGMETPLSRDAAYDTLVRVSDIECVVGCRRLAQREAILAGASSGGVVSAFTRMAPDMEPGARCALVFPDGGSGYFGTVFDDAWVGRELGADPTAIAALIGA